MMNPFSFNTTPSLRMGAGLAGELGQITRPICGDRVLLVTDPGMMATGLVQQATDCLRAAGVEVTLFDQVQADPPEEIVLQAAQQARRKNRGDWIWWRVVLGCGQTGRAFGRFKSAIGGSLRDWQRTGSALAAGFGANHCGDWLRGDANFDCNHRGIGENGRGEPFAFAGYGTA